MWDRPGIPTKHRAVYYFGPALLLGEKTLITQPGAAYSLATGERVLEQETMTGRGTSRSYDEKGGCGITLGSRRLLLLRTGYYDLGNFTGKSRLLGFRSGCVNSLIAANGLLNAPEHSLGCGCNYPMWTSLAMVHMPEMETWTNPNPGLRATWLRERRSRRKKPEPIRQVGINFGAPGDRRAQSGTLWLRYPFLVPRPDINMHVHTEPEQLQCFRRHSLRMRGGPLPWVAASGAQGLQSLTVTLNPEEPDASSCLIRLFFAEPEGLKPGDRVFSVAIQGRPALKDLDVVKEAGGPSRAVVKEFKGVRVKDKLEVTLKAAAGETLLCGMEIAAED